LYQETSNIYHLLPAMKQHLVITGTITGEARFTNKFSEQKQSQMTNGVRLRTRKLATAVGDKLRGSVRECQLLVNFGSVQIPA
jgi:hypothetical protein